MVGVGVTSLSLYNEVDLLSIDVSSCIRLNPVPFSWLRFLTSDS